MCSRCSALLQLEDCPAPDHVDAVLDKELDHRDQAQLARLPANNGGAGSCPNDSCICRVFEQNCFSSMSCDSSAALQLDDDVAHAFARGVFVAHGRKCLRAFSSAPGFRQCARSAALCHLYGFGDDDAFAVLGGFFDGCLSAHDEAASARFCTQLQCRRGPAMYAPVGKSGPGTS